MLGGVMGRLFAYCRVSTSEQTVENQILAILNAGFNVAPERVVSDVVSGSMSAMERDGFANLVKFKLERGDSLVVLKLDRLGRDSIDILDTVNLLSSKGVCLHCLDLPVTDLSKPEGRLVLQMFGAFAEFERNRIKERVLEGLARAKRNGVRLGRPPAINTYRNVQKLKLEGLSQSLVANRLGLGIATVKRHWKVSDSCN